MALIPKTSLVRFRLDPELMERFQVVCDAQRTTVSEFLRQMMLSRVETFEQNQEDRRFKALRAAPAHVPAPEPFRLEKTPPDPVKTPPKGNREQRRAATLDAKHEAKLDKKRGL